MGRSVPTRHPEFRTGEAPREAMEASLTQVSCEPRPWQLTSAS
jgi:hypothetical protein